jgi:Ca2+-transporting ATPase
MDSGAVREAEAAVRILGERGMRVLAVAGARFPSDPGADPSSLSYRFEGLLGFADPVRGDVPAALAEARRAGIGVAMITGDYSATALAVAGEAGIDTAAGALTGADLAGGAVPEARMAEIRVFARIMPEQKLQLVQSFKAAGQIVAMTGDGINDAPALAAAHVGIAMGRRGTDVAREASDLILLDDRFASIVGGIRLGRRIFTNLRRAMTFIAAIHVPIAGLALLPILLGLPPMLYPMHVVMLELLLDPLCSLVFEGEPSEEESMSKPPRRADEPLFGARQMLLAAVQGAVLLAAVLALYWWSLARDMPESGARTAAFVALVVGNLSLALTEASSGSVTLFDRRRVAFWTIAGIAPVVLALSVAIAPLADILKFAPLSGSQLLVALAVGIAAGGWYRIARRFPRAAAPA